MVMTLVVVPEKVEGGTGTDESEISPGLLYGSAIAVLGVVLVVAVREPRAADVEEALPPREEKGDTGRGDMDGKVEREESGEESGEKGGEGA
jgi:hypothetical protein